MLLCSWVSCSFRFAEKLNAKKEAVQREAETRHLHAVAEKAGSEALWPVLKFRPNIHSSMQKLISV